MPNDRMLLDMVDETLVTAVRNLFRSRTQQDHWNDVRSTAAAVWALEHVVHGQGLPTDFVEPLQRAIAHATTWLAGQLRREEGGASWESEAWDTSFAMLALIAARVHEDRVDQAAAWLLNNVRSSRSGVWYDEIWETTLVTVALLRREAARKGPRAESDALVLDVITWLNGIPQKDSGEYVNPHYSGFLVWLDAEIRAAGLKARTLSSEPYATFRNRAEASARWLIAGALDNPDDLWSKDTFANAYVAFALASHPEFRRRDSAFLLPVVRWLREQQGTSGGYEDTEDTALAVAALAAIRTALDAPAGALERALSRLGLSELSQSKAQCFLGYAGRARHIAAQVKDYLAHDVPSLTLVDWTWDFRVGSTLSEEIESRSRDCQMAIFILTKDDLIVGSGPARQAPRDNVIFEVGVFFGTVGRERTLLLVQEGVELPSDWSGLLHIPFANADDLSSIHARLRRAIGGAMAAR